LSAHGPPARPGPSGPFHPSTVTVRTRRPLHTVTPTSAAPPARAFGTGRRGLLSHSPGPTAPRLGIRPPELHHHPEPHHAGRADTHRLSPWSRGCRACLRCPPSRGRAGRAHGVSIRRLRATQPLRDTSRRAGGVRPGWPSRAPGSSGVGGPVRGRAGRHSLPVPPCPLTLGNLPGADSTGVPEVTGRSCSRPTAPPWGPPGVPDRN
jgi:hypothetical protein